MEVVVRYVYLFLLEMRIVNFKMKIVKFEIRIVKFEMRAVKFEMRIVTFIYSLKIVTLILIFPILI